MAIARNSLYRQRRIKIEAFDHAAQPDFPSFELTEVNDVSVGSASETAVAPGVMAPIIQPWYFKPFSIEISGKSYIGAFDSSFLPLNIATDDDVNQLIKLRTLVNQKFSTTGIVNRVELLITYDDPAVGGDNNLHISQTFKAVYNGLAIKEDETKPYLKHYNIKFVAQLTSVTNITDGSNQAQEDQEGVEQFGTGKAGGRIEETLSGIKTRQDMPKLEKQFQETTLSPVPGFRTS